MTPPVPADLSLDVLERANDVCDRFEAAWAAGRSELPSIVPFLEGFTGSERDHLFRELLLADEEQRVGRGRPPADYLRDEFPEYAELIAVATSRATQPIRIGRYEVDRELGRGGMGAVYLARDADLNRPVAVKVVLNAAFGDNQEFQRFRAEAVLTARLTHPNVVRVYEVGEDGGKPFIAMEYLPGGSLADRLSGGPLTPTAAALLIGTVAAAMDDAHRAGMVHRDLKPANILFAADGTPKVTDFGLAKELDRTSMVRTRTGAIVGTPSFMAPEQATGVGQVSTRTDVYALGATLYACLTALPPFRADSVLHTLDLVRTSEPVRPSRVTPGVSGELDAICLRCLEKSPHRRYASVSDLAADLGRFLSGESVLARPAGPATRARKWVARNPVVAALAAVSLGLFLAGTVGVTAALVYALDGWALADANQKQTEGALGREQGERRRAEEISAELESTLYAAEVNVAHRQWGDHRGQDRMLALLDKWRPTAGRPDRRGWEWYWLAGLPTSGATTLPAPGTKLWGVAWSSDGKWVAAGGDDRGVHVWDAATGRPIRTMTRPTGLVRGIAWLPGGNRIVTASTDGRLTLWDVDMGQVRWEAAAHVGEAPAVAVTPDGRRLASGGHDKLVKVWSADGNELARYGPFEGEVEALAFSADGRYLAVAGQATHVAVWDTHSGKRLDNLTGHKHSVFGLAWDPTNGGHRLATGSYDRTVRIWDAVAGRELTTLTGHTHFIRRVAWNADGTRLASAGTDDTIRLWDGKWFRPIGRLSGHRAQVDGLAWGPTSGRLASASEDGTVKLWDIDREPGVTILGGHDGNVWAGAVAWNAAGTRIATAAGDSVILLRSLNGHGPPLRLVGHQGGVTDLAWGDSDRRLASTDRNGVVRIWQTDSGKLLGVIPDTGNPWTAIAWNPVGDRLAIGDGNGNVRFFDHDGRTEVGRWALRHETSVSGIAWHPTEPLVATVGWDGRIVVSDPNGTVIREGRVGRTLHRVSWSPDAGAVVIGSLNDFMAYVWDVAGGTVRHRLEGHTDWVYGVAWNPHGDRLVTASADASIRVWDPTSGRQTLQLGGHTGPVNGVAWRPDGKVLATAAEDNTVRLWDATAGYAAR